MTDTAASCWWELCLRWWRQRVISPKLDNFFPTNESVSQMEKHHSCRNRASMVMSCEADVAIPRLNLLVRCFLFPSAGAVVRTEWKDFLRSCCFFCRLDSIWLILFFSLLVVLQLNQWGQLTLQRGSLIPQPWRERTPVTVWAPPWASPHLPAPH